MAQSCPMKSSALGSTFIVAGTALGAGMLAMPLATAGVGFFSALFMLGGLWAVMCYTALLLVEAYQQHAPSLGLASLAAHYLGPMGYWLATLAMPFLMYALVAAYISGGGELVQVSLANWLDWQLNSNEAILLFTLTGGAIVSLGTRSVDLVNRWLFAVKILFLLAMLMLLLPHVEQVNLLTLPVEQALILSAIPVVFTSFGFHGSVPSIVSYLGGDTQKLRWVFIIGSAIPLVIYILWQLATLGAIPSTEFVGILAEESGLNGLLTAVKDVVEVAKVEVAVRSFAALALATSFLGVALGLFDFLADIFQRQPTASGRLQTGLLTFIPPLCFALFYPKGFIFALGFAAIALSVLSLLLPAMMVWQLRKHTQNTKLYRVAGGSLGLAVVFSLGLVIILIQLGVVLGKLPAVG